MFTLPYQNFAFPQVSPQSRPAMDPDTYVVVVDLRYAYSIMSGFVLQAFANRGITSVDPSECREMADQAVGGIVTYVLNYTKNRAKPTLSFEQSDLVKLAHRMGDVFYNVQEAVQALHEVEVVILETIGEHLDSGNNFDIVEYQLINYTLLVQIKPHPPKQLQMTPSSF